VAIIKSGSGTDQWTIDSESKAGRTTDYLPDGSLASPSAKPTYSAAIAVTPGATPQDVITIQGSSTKVIKITKMSISTNQTTSGVNSWYLVRRSTPNTGGTYAPVVPVSHDRNDTPCTAIVLQYTSNPTLGASIGYAWVGHIPSPAVAPYVIDFSDSYGKPITLRGTGDVLALNFNGVALPSGLAVRGVLVWTEEDY
jgi:hypothetical protein